MRPIRSFTLTLAALSPLTLPLVACDGGVTEGAEAPLAPAPELHDELAGAQPLAAVHPARQWMEHPPEYLVSRFAPTVGLAGTTVRLLVGFDPSGCAASGDCHVTVGGAEAEIVEDFGLIEAVVPRLATTGPVCVTWQARTECGQDFTVLPAPIIYAVAVSPPDGKGEVQLTVDGAGYLEDALLVVGWSQLTTTWAADWRLTATVPREVFEADPTVRVYSPSSGRCGTYSEPFAVTAP